MNTYKFNNLKKLNKLEDFLNFLGLEYSIIFNDPDNCYDDSGIIEVVSDVIIE